MCDVKVLETETVNGDKYMLALYDNCVYLITNETQDRTEADFTNEAEARKWWTQGISLLHEGHTQMIW